MRKTTILAVFISLMVVLMIISIYLYYFVPVSEFSYSSIAFVTRDTSGFDVNSTAITFGSFAVGGSSTRTVSVNNSYHFPIKLKPHVDGSISKIISYEPLTVRPYEVSKMYFTVSADSLNLLGNYTGNITIRMMRA